MLDSDFMKQSEIRKVMVIKLLFNLDPVLFVNTTNSLPFLIQYSFLNSSVYISNRSLLMPHMIFQDVYKLSIFPLSP